MDAFTPVLAGLVVALLTAAAYAAASAAYRRPDRAARRRDRRDAKIEQRVLADLRRAP